MKKHIVNFSNYLDFDLMVDRIGIDAIKSKNEDLFKVLKKLEGSSLTFTKGDALILNESLKEYEESVLWESQPPLSNIIESINNSFWAGGGRRFIYFYVKYKNRWFYLSIILSHPLNQELEVHLTSIEELKGDIEIETWEVDSSSNGVKILPDFVRTIGLTLRDMFLENYWINPNMSKIDYIEISRLFLKGSKIKVPLEISSGYYELELMEKDGRYRIEINNSVYREVEDPDRVDQLKGDKIKQELIQFKDANPEELADIDSIYLYRLFKFKEIDFKTVLMTTLIERGMVSFYHIPSNLYIDEVFNFNNETSERINVAIHYLLDFDGYFIDGDFITGNELYEIAMKSKLYQVLSKYNGLKVLYNGILIEDLKGSEIELPYEIDTGT